jgi:hypothetical protein
MSTTRLTPELRRLIEQSGDRPIRMEDPDTHQDYVLIRADLYERFREVVEQGSGQPIHVPEGIRMSQEAFFRDLPELLAQPRLRGQYVAYRGVERVKVAKSERSVLQECVRRGLSEEEFDVFIIEPQTLEIEEVDFPSPWCEA